MLLRFASSKCTSICRDAMRCNSSVRWSDSDSIGTSYKRSCYHEEIGVVLSWIEVDPWSFIKREARRKPPRSLWQLSSVPH